MKLSAAGAVIVLNGILELVQPKNVTQNVFQAIAYGPMTRNAQDCGIPLAVKDTSDVNQGQASLKARYYANMDLDVFLSLVTSKKPSY